MVSIVNVVRVRQVTLEKLLRVAYDRGNQTVEWACRLCIISWMNWEVAAGMRWSTKPAYGPIYISTAGVM